MDVMVRRYGSHRFTGAPEAEAKAGLQHQLSAGREHNYKAWLQDLQHLRQRLPNERGLDHPAVASNVAILRDKGSRRWTAAVPISRVGCARSPRPAG